MIIGMSTARQVEGGNNWNDRQGGRRSSIS